MITNSIAITEISGSYSIHSVHGNFSVINIDKQISAALPWKNEKVSNETLA